jgi:tetratricopeptide (TPR) repeat protein
VDLGADGQAKVLTWPDGGIPEQVSQAPLTWPLEEDALEDLRWYLEDYLQAPFGVWEERGPAIREKLDGWGDLVFESVFGTRKARDAYQRARDRNLELVFRSADPGLLGLPWELMRDGAGPVAMGTGGISRTLPVADGAGTLDVPGGKLRVLMVISRPAGTHDVSYQMVARPLLERLDAVRGEVSLSVLRPPTFDALRDALRQAAEAGEPFHVVHFDGHGEMPGRTAGGGSIAGRPTMMTGSGEGVLAFEKPGGGSDLIKASQVAQLLADAKVPVVVLNACQSGAVGKELEASVAAALLKAGCAAVVAMAYTVYAVAAAEFMAAFYESLFAGESVGQAVTVGRKRLFEQDDRPSLKGDLPLADWLVPVHYLRREVRFPQARTARPAAAPSLDDALDQIRTAPLEAAAVQDPLAAVDGLFVGRDDLFYQLEAAARLQRVVVLTGPGGTGKTELAKGFARWWRDTGGVSDPRLVFWHSFEPGVASFGLDGVISEIGLGVFGADFARLDPPQRIAQVKALLGQLRVLLVWDNFESVREMPDPARATPPLDEAGCAALKDFLAWVRDHSSSAALVTSRAQEDWLGQVRRIGVSGLNLPEAAQYAGHLLEPYPAAQRRREQPSFASLLAWLDGHPLAMRLTLPRLDVTDPAVLLSDLRGTAPLPADGAPDGGRTTSLAASITYSYTHLAEQTRRLLPAVSLFHGIADVDVLMLFSGEETVPSRFAGISKDEWSAVLDDAAQVGLLTGIGAGMYQMHPALPGYLAAGWRGEDPGGYDQQRQASEMSLCAACAALSRWLTGQIETGDAAIGYAIIRLQRWTLGVMLGHALDSRAWTEASSIIRALDAYWDTRGLGAEAATWADRVLDVTVGPGQAPAEGAQPLWLYTTIRQATRQKDAGHPDQAALVYRRALDYLHDQPATDWTRGNIGVLSHQLGMAAQDRGRLDEAMDWYRQSLAIDEELGDRPGMASSYYQLGWASHILRRLDESEDWYRKSLAISEEFGDRPGMAMTYNALGVTVQDRGRLDEAEEWYRRSLAIKEELGDRPGMARTYHQLGTAAQDRGRLDEAEDWYRKSLAISEELGIRPGMAITYHELGMAAQDRGRLDEAEDWYRKSLAIREELGNRPGMAITYAQRGLLAEDRGQALAALEWNIRCVTLFDEFPSRLTGTGPSALLRLTRQLGMSALEEAWRQVAGQPLPQRVRDYITTYQDEDEDPEASP